MKRFIGSKYFTLLQLLIAACAVLLRLEVIGAAAFCVVLILVFIFSDDLLDTTLPFLLLSVSLIKRFDSFNDFLILVPLASVAFIFFLWFTGRNGLRRLPGGGRFGYRLKRGPGENFAGIAAVAAAVTLGGAGVISAKAYFSLTSLYYTLGLGVVMMFAYLVINALLPENGESVSRRFSWIMTVLTAFACFMVLSLYAEKLPQLLKRPEVLQFQWRNNICTFIMIGLPYPFYLSKYDPLYSFIGWAGYGCLLLSGSRGGMIFGTAELLLCLAVTLAFDKGHRRFHLTVISVLAAFAFVFGRKLVGFNLNTFRRMIDFRENRVRLGLFSRAIKDFRANPIFGSGLANWDNRDLHPSVRFALCWYHSAPFQIIGSFGLFGVVCYALRLFLRVRTIVRHRSRFTYTLAVSFAGLLMMSLVNPGEFCPLPYELMMTFTFALMERQSRRAGVEIKEG